MHSCIQVIQDNKSALKLHKYVLFLNFVLIYVPYIIYTTSKINVRHCKLV